jgi:hypothetical protein
MRLIEFACPGLGSLRVIGERLHDGYDFVVCSNAEHRAIDYLLFLDSRGIGRAFEHSLADKLIDKISQLDKTYLLICRPLELTVWATLVGFLAQNKLNPNKIITNMGFVDFTPKKQSILEDVVRQVNTVVGREVATAYLVEQYFSSGGSVVPLFAMHYEDAYRCAIEALAKRHALVILNSPLVDSGIVIQRKRPDSFFPALADSNAFNHSITGAKVVDLPIFDETHTYDAVHFTCRGNELAFERLQDYL